MLSGIMPSVMAPTFSICQAKTSHFVFPNLLFLLIHFILKNLGGKTIDIESLQNRLLKVCYVPLLVPAFQG
jgi:hypothetical protein